MSEATGLPNGWCRTTLGALGTFINGDRGKNYPSKSAFVESGVPFINAGHLIKGQIDLSEMNYITRQRFDILGSGKVQSNDVLYCIRGSLGKAAMVTSIEQGAIASSLVIIRPARTLIHRYVYYFLVSPLGNEQISKYDNGSAQPNLSAANVKLYSIPFAPLNEQRRIVAKIDELFSDLDAGVGTLERVRANLKRYRATVLKAAVEGKLTEDWRAQHPDTEPASVLLERILTERRRQWEKDQLARFAAAGKEPPKGWREKYQEPLSLEPQEERGLPARWCFANVAQVSHYAKYGSSAKASEATDGVPVLRMGNIQDGRLDLSDLKYLPEDHDEFPDLLLRKGDLLFNRTNSAELVGKSAVYEGAPFPCSFASYLISVRAIIGCDPRMLCFFINSVYGRGWIASVVSQQVGQANVNGTKLQALAFPLAPRAYAPLFPGFSGVFMENIRKSYNVT